MSTVLRTTASHCFVCERPVSSETEWVKEGPGAPIFGLCRRDAERILRGDLSFQWRDGAPVLYPTLEDRVARIEQHLGLPDMAADE